MKALRCSNIDCGSRYDLVGGHVVIVVDGYISSIYIVPICKDCNNQGSDFRFEVNEENLLLLDKDLIIIK